VLADPVTFIFFSAGDRPEEWISDFWMVAKTASGTHNQSVCVQCNKRWGVPKRGQEAGAGWVGALRLQVSVQRGWY